MSKLFSPFRLGSQELRNRIVMAPMTRSRAIGSLPNDLMATYYGQRATAGLIITEGVSPSPNGLGYARTPGIFNAEQIRGWQKITRAVHRQGGHLFMQIMHTGRVGHLLNKPAGARVLAPSSLAAPGQVWTDEAGMQDFPLPGEMTAEDLDSVFHEFIRGAKYAVEAGFDGVELHGANGYLLEQFLSPYSNQRPDDYGGSVENRSRFVLELAKKVSEAIGSERTAIRLSPYGAANGMKEYPEVEETYRHLAAGLGRLSLAYLHLVDHSSMGAPAVPRKLKRDLKDAFAGPVILTGGYDRYTAEADLQQGEADLIGFGKPFINNPDLVYRMQFNKPLSGYLDKSTFYSAGEKGFTDYPVSEPEGVAI
jgi:N-ethylmaleimide reductase